MPARGYLDADGFVIVHWSTWVDSVGGQAEGPDWSPDLVSGCRGLGSRGAPNPAETPLLASAEHGCSWAITEPVLRREAAKWGRTHKSTGRHERRFHLALGDPTGPLGPLSDCYLRRWGPCNGSGGPGGVTG
jgi:hypothetical protein